MANVCVIMPAYCAAATIRGAVDSIIGQSFKDWELIIIDDASTDRTWEIAEERAGKDSRIRVIRQDKNLGAAAAMNRAWAASSAPLVAIMDADDVSLPHRILRQVEHLAGNEEISVLGTAAHFVDASHCFIKTVTLPASHEDLVRRRWMASPFIHPTVIMRREFLEATGGYQDGLRLGEDYDLWMRGMQQGFGLYNNLPLPSLIYRTRRIQRWTMIKASAGVRMRAGRREGRRLTAAMAAMRILLEGSIERTGIFGVRRRWASGDINKPDLSALESG